MVAVILVAAASLTVWHALTRGDRVGQWTSATSLADQARPLPTFVDDALGSPVAGYASMKTTYFPGRLGDPLTSGFGDRDQRQVGFALQDPPATVARSDYQYGVRFTTRDVDIVHDNRTALLREQLVVRRHQGTKTWRWTLTGPGRARLAADGSIQMTNGASIEAPKLYDETGKVLDIPGLAWNLRGREFSLTIDDSNIALPYVIDPDGTNPEISIDNISTSSPCVYVISNWEAWVRSLDCAGSFDVTVQAYDVWQDNTESNTSGLGTGTTAGTYGVNWNNPNNTLNTTGSSNWTRTSPQYEAGAEKGLNVTCWGNNSFTGPADGSGVDNKLDYSAENNVSGFNHSSTDDPDINTGDAGNANVDDPFEPASLLAAVPPNLYPYSNAMSCRWTGYVTGRNNSGNYQFMTYSDDGIRLDVGANTSDPFPIYSNCTGGTPAVCNWTPHGPTWNGPSGNVNFASPYEAHPITVIWNEGGGRAATGVIWNPPGGPALANNPQAGYEVIPESALVTDVYYTNTYNFGIDAFDPLNGNFDTQIVARDQNGRTRQTPFRVKMDNRAPDPAVTFTAATAPDWTNATQSGWTNDNTIVLSKRDAGETGSGIASILTEVRFAPLNPATNECGAPQPIQTVTTGWTYSTGSTQNYNFDGDTGTAGTQPAPDGCYYFQYTVKDRVNGTTVNKMTATADINDPTTWIKVDTQPPAYSAGTLTFTPEPGSADYLYSPAAGQLFYNSTTAGAVRISAGVTDDGRGVDRVVFPDPDGGAAGWPLGSITDDVDKKTTPYQAVMSWSSGATSLGALNALAYDLVCPGPAPIAPCTAVGNGPTSIPYTITADSTPPSGGTLTTNRQPGCAPAMANNDYFNTDVCLSRTGVFTDGAGSGIDTSRAIYERRESNLVSGVCDPLGAWGIVPGSTTNPAASFVDTSTVTGKCYEYRYALPDRVTNWYYLYNNVVVRKDTVAPTGLINPITPNPTSGLVTVSGNAADAASGVDYVRVEYDGPDPGTAPDADWCPAAPPGPPLSGGNWSCIRDTSAFPDGTYTLILTVYDKAGNSYVAGTETVVLDNQPPVVDNLTFTDPSTTNYHYAVNCSSPPIKPVPPAPQSCTPRVYFNPDQSGSFDIDVDATDAGTGVATVTYPDIDGAATAWTPSGGVVGSPYTLNFSWTGPGATASAFLTANVTDNAGATNPVSFQVIPDNTPPVGLLLNNPAGAYNALSVPITYTVGNDGAGAGIDPGSETIERHSAPFSSPGVCGAYGGASAVTLTAGNDTTVLNGNCYQYRLVVKDRVGNVTTTGWTTDVMVDTTPPTGSLTTTPAATYVSGTIQAKGSAADTYSGLTGGAADITVAFTGGSSGTICTGVNAATYSTGCNWDTTLVGDGSYTITTTITDRAGNTFSPPAVVVTVDNTPPSVSFNSFVEGTGAQYQAVDLGNPQLQWYNDTAPAAGSFAVRINASDGAGSQVNTVGFPLFGAGWSVSPGSGIDSTAPSPYEVTYTWTGAAAEPGAVNATATDFAGRSATQGFTVQADTAPPLGGSINPPNGSQSATSVAIPFTVGTDAQAGIDMTNGYRIERAEATMTGGVCGAFGLFAQVGPLAPATPSYTDTGLVDGKCYQYQLVVTDRVGRTTTYPGAGTVSIDQSTPSGTINPQPTYVSGVINFDGTATDSGTGPSSIILTYDDGGGTSGTICSGQPPLTTVPSASTPWSCPGFNTTSIPDGTYTIDLVVADAAGNTSPAGSIQIPLIVDNTNPSIAFAGFTEVSGVNFQHIAGSTLWYNPAQSGSVTVDITASDTGSGVANVTFPDHDGVGNTLWTNTGLVDTVAPYSKTFTWTAGVAPFALGPQTVTATDNAGRSATAGYTVSADTTPPAGGGLNVTDQTINTTTNSLPITFTSGTDAESGIWKRELWAATATLQNDGTCGAYGPFTNTGMAIPSSPITVTGLVNATCYMYELHEFDNVSNSTVYTSAGEIRVDLDAPTGAVALTPAGPWGGTIGINGTAADSLSGVDHVIVTYDGPGANDGVVCTSPALGGTAPNFNNATWGVPDCNWDTIALALPDGSYTINVEVFDRAGNSAFGTPRIETVDNNPPTPFTHLDFSEGAGGNFLFWNGTAGTPMWYNPAGAATFTVRMSAADAGVGMSHVAFPTLGAGWSPAGANVPGATPYAFTYSYTASPAAPNTVTASAFDTAGNSSTANFTVSPDNTAPAGGTLQVPGGTQSTTTAAITYTLGTDLQAGVGSWSLERSSSPLAGGVCTGFGPFTPIGGASPPSPYSDTTLASGNCYEYRLIVKDKVDNSATITDPTTFTIMVDGGNPSATISGTPTGPIAGNGNVFTGTATDPETSIDHVDVTYSGPASGTMCSGLAVIAGNWTCTFDTNPGPALPDGLYTLTVEAFDAAGNSSGPVTRTVVVDNNGPVLNSLTLVEASGGQYIHVSGTTAYFNPAGAGTIRVD
ncbi:MAG: Ig-like domain repeat protein, partial [Thermoleophilia bacterium]|nr:Ig-like domain repeat protein [Thermoleophilia bacterium]